MTGWVMRRTTALLAVVGLVFAIAPLGRLYQARAQANAYTAIDGKRLWQYVKAQTDIAERYRDQGHPQFWGRIAGTSGDVEAAQWLLKKYQQIGLTDARIQDVSF